MNTIPTIFNARPPSYTVVGGKERLGTTGLSAVLLNRSAPYSRRSVFQELERTGFDYVVSMECNRERYDVEELSGRFPFVRFILLPQSLSPGEQINLAVSELTSPLFFVLWNDTRILTGGGAGRIADRLCLDREDLKSAGNAGVYKRLCTVPVIQNARCETLPTLTAPSVSRGTVKPLIFNPQKEELPSLYPFDSMGIYDRERFVRLGGFDLTLKNPYWQLMDFGFRSYLWGEEIRVTQQLKVSREGEFPVADTSPDESYRRFYLKNLALVFRGDYAHLPLRRFPAYFGRSRIDPLSAWEEFLQARRWVKTNRFRFRSDARTVNDLWENIEPAQTEGS